jgi:hypothetical protein
MSIDRAGVISFEDGLASGLGASFVQRAKKYGGGFLVNVEGMHHLHCLVNIAFIIQLKYSKTLITNNILEFSSQSALF